MRLLIHILLSHYYKIYYYLSDNLPILILSNPLFWYFHRMANVAPLGTLMKSFLFLTRNHWHSLFTYYLCCFLSHSDLALMALVLGYLLI